MPPPSHTFDRDAALALSRKAMRKAILGGNTAEFETLISERRGLSSWITPAMVAKASMAGKEAVLSSLVSACDEDVIKKAARALFKKEQKEGYMALAKIAGRPVIGNLMEWIAGSNDVALMKEVILAFGRRGHGPELATDALVTAAERAQWGMYQYLLTVAPHDKVVRVAERIGRCLVCAANPPPLELVEQVLAWPHGHTDMGFRQNLLTHAADAGQAACLPLLLDGREMMEQYVTMACVDAATKGHTVVVDCLVARVGIEALADEFARQMNATAWKPRGREMLKSLQVALDQMGRFLPLVGLNVWVERFGNEDLTLTRAHLLQARALAPDAEGAVPNAPQRARVRP